MKLANNLIHLSLIVALFSNLSAQIPGNDETPENLYPTAQNTPVDLNTPVPEVPSGPLGPETTDEVIDGLLENYGPAPREVAFWLLDLTEDYNSTNYGFDLEIAYETAETIVPIRDVSVSGLTRFYPVYGGTPVNIFKPLEGPLDSDGNPTIIREPFARIEQFPEQAKKYIAIIVRSEAGLYCIAQPLKETKGLVQLLNLSGIQIAIGLEDDRILLDHASLTTVGEPISDAEEAYRSQLKLALHSQEQGWKLFYRKSLYISPNKSTFILVYRLSSESAPWRVRPVYY